MDELEREMARVLRAARSAHDPSAADAQRVRGALAATLGVSALAVGGAAHAASAGVAQSSALAQMGGGAVAVGSASGSAGGVAAASGTLVSSVTVGSTGGILASSGGLLGLAKFGAMGMLIGTLGVGAGVSLSSSEDPGTAAPGDAAAVPVDPGSRRAAPGRAVPLRLPLSPSSEPRAPALARNTDAEEQRGARLQLTPAAASAAAGRLREESLALKEAQEMLEEQPALALAKLRVMEERHPRGALAEEAMVARVLAYCNLGREEVAASLAARFSSIYPDSVHDPRIRASCVGRRR